MASTTSSKSKSTTQAPRSRPRYQAIYTPTADHVAVPGIPARDLTPDEVERYGGIELLRNAQCYTFAEVEQSPPPEE